MQRPVLFLLLSLAWALPGSNASLDNDNEDTVDFLYEGQARTFYFNSSNDATATTILGILLLLGFIVTLIYYELALTPQSNAGFNRPQFNNQFSGR